MKEKNYYVWKFEWKYFCAIGFFFFEVMTDKKSSTILIYKNTDTAIYTENNGIN